MTWPPTGRLGRLELHQARDGGLKHVEAMLHIRAVFQEGGVTKILTAHWWPHARRWDHRVYEQWHLEMKVIWSYGQAPADSQALIDEDVNR